MKVFLVALLALPLFAGAQSLYDHYNDAYFTGDGSLPNLVEANGLGSKTSFGQKLPDTQPNPEEPAQESPGAKESQLPPAPEASPTPNAEAQKGVSVVIEDEEDILTLLEEGGAVSGVASLPGSLDEAIDFENYAGGGFRIVVDGAKVRGLFGRSVSVDEILGLWKTSSERQKRGKNISTGQYYALIAATLAEDDVRLARAEFTNVYLEVTYRSRGAMLWVIPWSFPVRVMVAMDPKKEERVTVRFPWYHWFVREYFTRESLAAEVRDVILAEEAKAGDKETLQVRLFVALSAFLKQKVRTISDSIILGS